MIIKAEGFIDVKLASLCNLCTLAKPANVVSSICFFKSSELCPLLQPIAGKASDHHYRLSRLTQSNDMYDWVSGPMHRSFNVQTKFTGAILTPFSPIKIR